MCHLTLTPMSFWYNVQKPGIQDRSCQGSSLLFVSVCEDDWGVKEPWLYVIQILGLDMDTKADVDMGMWTWIRCAWGEKKIDACMPACPCPCLHVHVSMPWFPPPSSKPCLHIHVCMSMSAFLHVHLCFAASLHVHVCKSVCMSMFACLHVHACIPACRCLHVCMPASLRVHVCISECPCLHVCMSMSARLNVCMACLHVCIVAYPCLQVSALHPSHAMIDSYTWDDDGHDYVEKKRITWMISGRQDWFLSMAWEYRLKDVHHPHLVTAICYIKYRFAGPFI